MHVTGPLDPRQREQLLLAPWAMNSRDTRGRAFEEPKTELRTPYQRDRDRVIHSTAFRRLEYKTQVFVNHEGDHYRTRLTHTLEVAQIARAVARSLGLNEDLVEAIALSHDLGHPPFGHAGEEILKELMAEAGGFDHNRHCLRIVTELERRYPDFPGLNLTWEVREAIVKHCGRAGNPQFEAYDPDAQPTLEAQLVDVCDAVAYSNHDIDDGIRSGYVSLLELREIELWAQAERGVSARWPDIPDRQLVARTVSSLIDAQVTDLCQTSLRRIEDQNIDSVDAARAAAAPLIGFSEEMDRMKADMQVFLHSRLYRHHRTLKMTRKGQRFIEAIFLQYRQEPGQLPPEYLARVDSDGVESVICDYIAGMTDRFCNQEYARLFTPFAEGGILP